MRMVLEKVRGVNRFNCDICIGRQRRRDTPVEIGQQMIAARGRLISLARSAGMPPDAAEDVVQETLLEAWYHLTMLGMPEQLDAWLDGICRNMCRRWRRAAGTARHRYARLPDLSFADEAHAQAGLGDLLIRWRSIRLRP